MRPVHAVIFDMDGLLLDSERLAIDALVSAGKTVGYEMPYSFCRKMVGVAADGCRKLVRETYGPEFPLEEFFRAQEVILRELVDTGKLTLKKGVEPLLDYLEQNRVPRAIATSSSRVRTDHHLKMIGIFHRFDAIVTRDDVTNGKPNPEPYLTAAGRLGFSPDDCLALEDSHSGARAAHAAGIRVIVIPDLLEPNEEIREKALEIMEDLHGALSYIQRANAR
ncbi:HAD family hydrolase [Silvibacterium sp.]|uniref:HAD family hydrolase n=1 Tax=Silvibacterium sp. TaxID=1964179 RepID=UPI0039E2C06C